MVRRPLAVGSIALTGLLLVAGAIRSAGVASDGVVALALVALGTVLGAAITAAAVYLYRSDVRTSHTARIAGWNALGVIMLLAEKRGDSATLSVRDRGPGMADHEVDELTEHSEISQLEHGSGLGLWVVKTIAERYGSDLDIETGETGTTVGLDLRAA